MSRRMLAGVVLVSGAVVWTIAKELTGNQLGALPTLIIVAPFIYWSQCLWRSGDGSAGSLNAERRSDIERRLELASANPKLSGEKRAEAKRRLENLRFDGTSTGVPVDEGSILHVPPLEALDQPIDKSPGGTRLPLLAVLVIAVIGLAAAGAWYEISHTPRSAAERSPQPSTASQSPDMSGATDSPESPSAFARRTFDGVTISLPNDWRPIGKNDAQSLNTASEALSGIGQGNNTILWAANAFDDANVTRATMRLSVRDTATIGQDDLREALTQPQDPIERELMIAAEQGAAAARKLPQTAYYKVTGAGLRENGHIVCTWTGYEYDIGKGPTISDLWVCPATDRTYKFTTSYAKARAALYAPTINYSWRSLSLAGGS